MNLYVKSKREKEKPYLGGYATHVEAGAAERPTLLDTSGLQAKLGGLDGGDIAAGPTAYDDDVALLRSRGGESPGESGDRVRVLEDIGARIREVPGEKVHLPSRKACQSHLFQSPLSISLYLSLSVSLREFPIKDFRLALVQFGFCPQPFGL